MSKPKPIRNSNTIFMEHDSVGSSIIDGSFGAWGEIISKYPDMGLQQLSSPLIFVQLKRGIREQLHAEA